MGVQYQGFEELRAYLQQLPDTMQARARTLVEHTTDQAATDLLAVYPPGEMRNAVYTRITDTTGVIGVRGQVVSPSPIAHLWEFGTQVRTTQLGWNRGSEPAHPLQGLVTIAIKRRREMVAAAVALVEEAGFTVTGA